MDYLQNVFCIIGLAMFQGRVQWSSTKIVAFKTYMTLYDTVSLRGVVGVVLSFSILERLCRTAMECATIVLLVSSSRR